MRSLAVLLAFLGLSLGVIGSVHTAEAETDFSKITRDKVKGTTRIYDALVQYPMPYWYERGDPDDCCEFYRTQKDPAFLIEHTPKGEEFGKWSQLYGLQGEKVLGEQDISLDHFYKLVAASQYRFCDPNAFGVEKIAHRADSYLSVTFCGSTANGPTNLGYGPEVGEIVVLKQYVIRKTLLQVYHRWRGSRFSVEAPATWPVSLDEIRAVVGHFQRVQVAPYPGN